MIPVDIGGYPVNYGFVPQTVSYDGDPFDALVLGPPLPDGRLVRGVIVGVMFMEDEKGLDSKVVLSRTGADGRPLHRAHRTVQQEIGDYFNATSSTSPAHSRRCRAGDAAEGLAYVATTHAFFRECRQQKSTSVRHQTVTSNLKGTIS